MNTLLTQLKTSLALTLFFAVVLCGAYPFAVWACAQLAFPAQARGSLITDKDGVVRGSSLIGQAFTSERYFHPRPSAAGSGNGYDATASGGSNLGPTSQKLADAIKGNITVYRIENTLPVDTPVPADAVTTSASGLDPHISIANAQHQAPRIARVRKLPLETVRALITANIESRDFGIFGEERVNVLLLNRALDTL